MWICELEVSKDRFLRSTFGSLCVAGSRIIRNISHQKMWFRYDLRTCQLGSLHAYFVEINYANEQRCWHVLQRSCCLVCLCFQVLSHTSTYGTQAEGYHITSVPSCISILGQYLSPACSRILRNYNWILKLFTNWNVLILLSWEWTGSFWDAYAVWDCVTICGSVLVPS
jgi:hypothetical protein